MWVRDYQNLLTVKTRLEDITLEVENHWENFRQLCGLFAQHAAAVAAAPGSTLNSRTVTAKVPSVSACLACLPCPR